METWKQIDGYDGKYEVSSKGRVKSFARGERWHTLTPLLIGGYHLVCLRWEGKNKFERVHRLVASAFLKNPLNKKFVNHRNGKKLDNNLENLEWVTPQENTIHAVKNGRKSRKKGKEDL